MSNTKGRVYFWLIAAAVLLANTLISRSWVSIEPLSFTEWPVAFDLLVLLPLLFWWVHRRQGKQAIIGAGALALSAVTIGDWMIPNDQQQIWPHLITARYAVLAVFVIAHATLFYLLAKSLLHRLREEHVDLVLPQIFSKRLGSGFSSLVMTLEARVWLYAFSRQWIKKPYPAEQQFSYAKQSGNALNQQGFLILMVAEIPIAHLLIHLYSPTLALWITVLSIYGLVFLLAEYRATLYRPITIEHGALVVRYGVLFSTEIPLQQISEVTKHAGPVKSTKDRIRLVGMGEPNVRIALPASTPLMCVIGQKSVREIYLGVDCPEKFVVALNAHMARHQQPTVADNEPTTMQGE